MKAAVLQTSFLMFIMLYKLIMAFVFVEEILKCDYSHESYSEVISCGAVYHSVTGFRLLSLVQMKIIEQYLRLVLFTTLYMVSLSHNIFMKCYFKPSWA